MKSATLRLILLVIFTAVYNYFFWHEKLGINLFLFSAFLLISVLWQSASIKHLFNRGVMVTVTGTVITGVMVVWHNTLNAKIAHIISFFLAAGFIQQGELRSLYYSFAQVTGNYFMVPGNLSGVLGSATQNRINGSGFWFYLRLIILPLLLLLVFYLIFYHAVPEFGKAATDFFEAIGDGLRWLFGDITFIRLLFILTGLVLVSGLLLYRSFKGLGEKEEAEPDQLLRKRTNYRLRPYRVVMAVNELRKEYRAAFFMLVSINLLLLIVNIFDVRFVWFNFTPHVHHLKAYVHEGTWLLVASILLSMVIILYYFRKNLNFYPGNHWLKRLGILWMMQNLVLCISVFIRNSRYIEYHGLAYKRIGVMLFLVLTMVGLVTMVIRIYRTRSSWYQLRANTWAAYAMLVLVSLVNWDVLIAKVNVNHWNLSGIDVDFYQQLSPKALPVVMANLDKVEKQIEGLNRQGYTWYRYKEIHSFRRDINEKAKHFIYQEDHKYTWLSWNKADGEAYEYFRQHLKEIAPAYTVPEASAEQQIMDVVPAATVEGVEK